MNNMGILDSINSNYSLKTLEEHEKLANDWYKQSLAPQPNGIACPQCGTELLDSNPKILLTTNPPRKNIHCPKCGYNVLRIA